MAFVTSSAEGMGAAAAATALRRAHLAGSEGRAGGCLLIMSAVLSGVTADGRSPLNTAVAFPSMPSPA